MNSLSELKKRAREVQAQDKIIDRNEEKLIEQHYESLQSALKERRNIILRSTDSLIKILSFKILMPVLIGLFLILGMTGGAYMYQEKEWKKIIQLQTEVSQYQTTIKENRAKLEQQQQDYQIKSDKLEEIEMKIGSSEQLQGKLKQQQEENNKMRKELEESRY